MSPNSGSELPKPEVVSLADFTQELHSALEQSKDPQTSISDSVESAQGVVNRLAAVEAGKIAVHPPLSQEQVAHYKASAETVLAIGAKARQGLEKTGRGRGLLSRLRESKPAPTPAPVPVPVPVQKPKEETKQTFKGTGSEAKE